MKISFVRSNRDWRGSLFAGAAAAVAFAGLVASSAQAEERSWRIANASEPLVAEFQTLKGDEVVLKDWAGDPIRVKIDQLHPDDRTMVQTLWRERLSGAVKRIDAAVDAALAENGIKPNRYATDAEFLRRIYLDLTGSIPTYEATKNFLSDTNPRKRPSLIARLVTTEDYVSHLYNYFGEQFRIQDYVPGTFLSMDAYSDWWKENLRTNRPFDEVAYDMLSSEGRIWDDPAVGFYLRDFDTPLDHVQYATKVLLGTDIACAQCHDDPFQDWTQMDYFKFSEFLGGVGTKDDFKRDLAKGAEQEIEKEIIKRHNLKDLSSPEGKNRLRQIKRDYEQPMRWMRDATQLAVTDGNPTKFRLPETYQYDDASPGDSVTPLVLFGRNPEKRPGETQRELFARWMTSPENPRFALNIANRMWARYFGRGVAMPLHNMNMDNIDIPELAEALEQTMIDVGFDLKLFAQIVLNTKTYQRAAMTTKVSEADDFYFQGPLLRRMSAEQVWDSLITLMTQEPLRFRRGDGSYYNATMNLTSVKGPITPKEYFQRVEAYNKYEGPLGNYIDMQKVDVAELKGAKPITPVAMKNDNMMGRRNAKGIPGLSYGSLLLTRASELPQPAATEHFLRKFGQSERNFVVGAASTNGSVPQVMEMMNGFATTALASSDSAIFQAMAGERDSMKKADIVFMSILNRKTSSEFERDLIYSQLKGFKSGSDGYSNLIWALLNTPEFFFIK